MNKRKKQILARWVDQVASTQRPSRARFDPRMAGFSLSVDDDSVYASGIKIGGLFVQPNARATYMVWVDNDPPLGGLLATHYLIRLLRQRGVAFYVGPARQVFNAAAIERGSLEVIHTSGHKGLLEWPDTLFRAKTEGRAVLRPSADWRTRSQWVRKPRVAYFLLGYDRQDRNAFFFCELPPGVEPTTVDEAYEALKPEAVREAERMGRRVKRQGDIFAIEQPTFKPSGYVQELAHALNTNHVLDEATVEGALFYGRGKMRHRPIGRRPDHRTLRLGKNYWLILKNTVPIVK